MLLLQHVKIEYLAYYDGFLCFNSEPDLNRNINVLFRWIAHSSWWPHVAIWFSEFVRNVRERVHDDTLFEVYFPAFSETR